MMKIAVLGGGNVAHGIAGDLTLRGHIVNLFELPQFQGNIKVTMERGGIELFGEVSGFARLNKVTTKIEAAVEGVDVVILAVPSFGHRAFARVCASHLKDGQYVILVPGMSGALEFHQVLNEMGIRKDVKIAETNWLFASGYRLTAPAQVTVRGSTAKVWLAAFPGKDTEEVMGVLKKLYPALIPAANVLETCLLNHNPVQHPPLMVLNASRIEYVRDQLTWTPCRKGETFDSYREGWTQSVALVAEAIDRERLAVCRVLKLPEINQLQLLYEDKRAVTPDGKPYTSMYEAIHSGYGSTPSSITDRLSLSHRYMTETVPYGLVTWASLAESLGISAPTMKSLIHIASIMTKKDYWREGRTVESLGISGMGADELISYLETGEPHIK